MKGGKGVQELLGAINIQTDKHTQISRWFYSLLLFFKNTESRPIREGNHTAIETNVRKSILLQSTCRISMIW
jgi:hypothetical protein